MNTTAAESLPIFSSVLARMHRNDAEAAEDLSRLLLPGLRIVVRTRVNPQDVEDVVQDTMVDVLSAIRNGQLHNPEALAAFSRTVAVRKCAACIGVLVNHRSRFSREETIAAVSPQPNPEQSAMESQKLAAARAVLSELSPKDREILRRFYLDEQSPETICAEMGLSFTQYRLLKSRAKAKFGEKGRSLKSRGAQTRRA
jgi:RNA polymerase sigma-70 factor (ECF subfamily)